MSTWISNFISNSIEMPIGNSVLAIILLFGFILRLLKSKYNFTCARITKAFLVFFFNICRNIMNHQYINQWNLNSQKSRKYISNTINIFRYSTRISIRPNPLHSVCKRSVDHNPKSPSFNNLENTVSVL